MNKTTKKTLDDYPHAGAYMEAKRAERAARTITPKDAKVLLRFFVRHYGPNLAGAAMGIKTACLKLQRLSEPNPFGPEITI